MATELLEAVVEDGVRITNFFNGRILTAEDLRREQDAARESHRALAGAVGEGVVRGLEVRLVERTLPAPTVEISAGLGFNREGDPVALPRDVKLRLLPAQAEADQEAGLFAVCDRPALVSEITNPGFYLLVARPASSLSREQVPTVDLSQEGIGSKCGARYAELGASFALVPLPLPAGSADAPLAQTLSGIAGSVAAQVERYRRGETGVSLELEKNLSQLRNGMAYWVAGRDAAGPRVASLAAQGPVAPTLATAPVEALRAAGALASCDLPLALLYVTRRQLEWVDMWAARRTPVPQLAPDPLPLADGLPAAESVAAFMQFRDHLASFLAGAPTLPAPQQVVAQEWFLFLPPAGVLPLQSGAQPGFSASSFFPALRANGPDALVAARIPALLRGALDHAPVELAAAERIWLYTVAGPQAAGAPQAILFTSYPLETELEVSPVRISGVQPWAGQVEGGTPVVHVGEPLVVTGKNFEASQGEHQVLIDGTPVPRPFLEATDTKLTFLLPELPHLPEAGKAAMLVVSNRSTAAFRPLKVLPKGGPTTGALDVELLSASPTPPLPGQPATFRFGVRNRTQQQTTVALAAVVSEPAWTTQVLPAAKGAAPVTGVLLNAGEERSVYVRTEIPPSTDGGKAFTVTLNAAAGGLAGSSDPQSFIVDAPENRPDPEVTAIGLVTTSPPSALQGTQVSVSPFYPVQVLVDVSVKKAATYEIRAEYVDGSGNVHPLSGWAISVQNASGGAAAAVSFVVTQAQIDAGNGLVSLRPQVLLSTQYYTNEQSGNVRVRVTRQGQAAGHEQVRDFTFSVLRINYWWYYYY